MPQPECGRQGTKDAPLGQPGTSTVPQQEAAPIVEPGGSTEQAFYELNFQAFLYHLINTLLEYIFFQT